MLGLFLECGREWIWRGVRVMSWRGVVGYTLFVCGCEERVDVFTSGEWKDVE
jgi:hypothetical protein